MFNSRFIQTQTQVPSLFTITPFTLPTTAYWTSVAYGASKYVAIAGGDLDATHNYGAYSYDGLTWLSMALPTNSAWSKIVWNGSIFLAISLFSTTYATSTDGINWTARTLPSATQWQFLAWNGSYWVVTSLTSARYSIDGLTWSTPTLSVGTREISGVFALGSTFVMTNTGHGGHATSTYYLASLTNGATWTSYSTGISAGIWVGGCSNNSAVLTIAGTVSALTTNALTWSYGTLPFTGSGVSDYYDSKFFTAQLNSPNFAYSSDGITWNNFTNSFTTLQILSMESGANGIACLSSGSSNQGFLIS